MALSWLTALKAVPWADVVQAAPGIVQGARKLFAAAKGAGGNAAPGGRGAQRDDALEGRVQQIEAGIEALQREQRLSAELIRSLAEQNASIIAALDVMRSRARVLTYVCIALVIGLAGLGLAIALR